jgi:hypothetical protein
MPPLRPSWSACWSRCSGNANPRRAHVPTARHGSARRRSAAKPRPRRHRRRRPRVPRRPPFRPRRQSGRCPLARTFPAARFLRRTRQRNRRQSHLQRKTLARRARLSVLHRPRGLPIWPAGKPTRQHCLLRPAQLPRSPGRKGPPHPQANRCLRPSPPPRPRPPRRPRHPASLHSRNGAVSPSRSAAAPATPCRAPRRRSSARCWARPRSRPWAGSRWPGRRNGASRWSAATAMCWRPSNWGAARCAGARDAQQ